MILQIDEMTRQTQRYIFFWQKRFGKKIHYKQVLKKIELMQSSKQVTLVCASHHHNRASWTAFCWEQSNLEIANPNCWGLGTRSCLPELNLSEVEPTTTKGRRPSTSPTRCTETLIGGCAEILIRNEDSLTGICHLIDLSETKCLQSWCCWDCTDCRRECYCLCLMCRHFQSRTLNDVSNVGQFAKWKTTLWRWQEASCRWRKRWVSSRFQLSFHLKNEASW